MSIRKNEYKIEIQDNLYLLVFHKSLHTGSGVAVSLYIHNYEYLKFDCFGQGGHYHIYDGIKNETIYFTEPTCQEQINRASSELTTNLDMYLAQSNQIQIRSFQIDLNLFQTQIEQMKDKMIEYENTYYAKSR